MIELNQPSKDDPDIFVETPNSILEKVLQQVKSYDATVVEPLQDLINRSMLAIDSEYCLDRKDVIKFSSNSEIAIIPAISGC